LFFFGVIISVGGLGFMGYLALTSEVMYTSLGATYANILVGMLSLPVATSFLMKKCIIAAGTKKLTKDGTNKLKNWEKPTTPFCQTISVVISPNGLNAYVVGNC
jgi:Na+/H+ antiporter NhaD/arsenite permease-like protein